MTARERVREALCTWQRTDRNRSLDTLARILEAELARVPAPDTVGAVMSEIRRRGWRKVSAEDRRAHMRWVAQHPRPSRRKHNVAG